MSTATEAILGGKLAPQTVTALRIGNTTQTGVTAAGADQATATAINTGVSLVVVTTAAASTGVRLPASRFLGDTITVVNQGLNGVNVYPATGDRINFGSANAAVVVPINTARKFVCTLQGSSTTWREA